MTWLISHRCHLSSASPITRIRHSGLSTTRFPFPNHPRPTPHEIFHLPTNASPSDIKSRYYDLVRHHHPDSPHARTHTPCPAARHTRFQSILSAYNTLRFPPSTRRGPGTYYGHGPGFDPYMAELDRRRRTFYTAERRKQAMENEERTREQGDGGGGVYGLREHMMLAFGVVALIGGLYPSIFVFPFALEKAHKDAAGNLMRARSDAREVGHVRREEVRRRVKDIKASNAKENDSGEG
ncbi:hypothetical protein P691DRAFT_734540 [Macrolepiota fuliginosa MF-IS2]|uniref:J domain-containing protein n=1 Tax=Macrolepiota fuliginosa MF-IS2 TaxID=1400762 RepID=A0A9P6BZ03_9AGAR|nr:hypothetical protein P691DRAFT_734540 [Macrolepiota fuliginosa MF-IS2]